MVGVNKGRWWLAPTYIHWVLPYCFFVGGAWWSEWWIIPSVLPAPTHVVVGRNILKNYNNRVVYVVNQNIRKMASLAYPFATPMDRRRSRALRTLGSDDCKGWRSRFVIGEMMLRRPTTETNGGGWRVFVVGGRDGYSNRSACE